MCEIVCAVSSCSRGWITMSASKLLAHAQDASESDAEVASKNAELANPKSMTAGVHVHADDDEAGAKDAEDADDKGAADDPGDGVASSVCSESLNGEPNSKLIAKINVLKQERDLMKNEKALNTRLLRNAERCRSRLKSKAKRLNSNDLMEVFVMRQQEAVIKKEKTKSATKGTCQG